MSGKFRRLMNEPGTRWAIRQRSFNTEGSGERLAGDPGDPNGMNRELRRMAAKEIKRQKREGKRS